MLSCEVSISSIKYETNLTPNLQTDVAFVYEGQQIAVEFHHKAEGESTENNIAIYILEKLKEYAINYGLAER